MATMGIVLDELTKAKLRKLAQRADRSMSAQIRYLINREFERLYGDGRAWLSSNSEKKSATTTEKPGTPKQGDKLP